MNKYFIGIVIILTIILSLFLFSNDKSSNLEDSNTNIQNVSKKNNSNNSKNKLANLKKQWSDFIISLNKKQNIESSNNKEMTKKIKFDNDTKIWAMKELPKIGRNIVNLEMEIEKEKDDELKTTLYSEYHHLQQEYYNVLNLLAPNNNINAETAEKMKEYKLIKKQFEEDGELSAEEKDKLAKIKRKIFFNE